MGPQINQIGGRLTIDGTRQREETRPPDKFLKDLDTSVLKVLAAEGVGSDTELAFAWEPGELETDLIAAGTGATETAQAVNAWKQARDHAMRCMKILDQPTQKAPPPKTTKALDPPTQPPPTKTRRVNLHGASARPSSSGPAAALPASTEVVEAESIDGDDKTHEISEKTLTEISCIIRPAGSDGAESIDLLRRMLEGADEGRIKRSIRCWHRLAAFAGVGPEAVTVATLC